MGRRTGVRVQYRNALGPSKVSLEPAADRTTNERQYDPSAFSSRSICTDASFGCGVYGIRLRPGLILLQVGEGWGRVMGMGRCALTSRLEVRRRLAPLSSGAGFSRKKGQKSGEDEGNQTALATSLSAHLGFEMSNRNSVRIPNSQRLSDRDVMHHPMICSLWL